MAQKIFGKDILGRDIKENDIVVIKGNGGSYGPAKPMEIGVVVGNCVKTLSTLKSGRRAGDIFLISNPTDEELKIRDGILNKLEEMKQDRENKKKEKKNKGNLIGGIYATAKENEYFLYLGKVRISIFNELGLLQSSEEGHLYKKFYCSNTGKKLIEYVDDDRNLKFDYNMRYYIQKSIKTVHGLAGISDKYNEKTRDKWPTKANHDWREWYPSQVEHHDKVKFEWL